MLPVSLPLEMVWIPAGTFTMGSPLDELGRLGTESQHLVTLTKGFWIGKYPVTQAQYKAVVGENPSDFLSFLGFMKERNPVENVSWKDAGRYCYLLNEMLETELPAGYMFSLPTEAQWEYACRAGTTKALNSNMNLLNSDKEDPRLYEIAWYQNNSNGKTHPVGEKKPNAWGLYDMHGNVWEWCRDWYGDYPAGAVTDPTGPSDGSHRVIRGGSWFSTARCCRSADRINFAPSYRYCDRGFRVALVPVQ